MTPEEQYLKVSRQLDELKKIQDQLKKEILQKHTTVGEIIPGLRLVRNNNLDAEELKKNLTPAQWNTITERVVVKDYLTAAVRRGKIDGKTVEGCRTPGAPYLKRV